MKTILVPTDFSPLALNAARYAATFASKINASVSLLHVYPIPMIFSEIPVPPQTFEALQTDAEDLMLQAKKDLAIIAPVDVPIETTVRAGGFLTGLQEYCQEVQPYAIVMSSHGNAGVESLLFGSNTISSIHRVKCPLIIIPNGAKFTAPKNIALACDMKKVVSTIPLEVIADLTRQFGSKLSVIHIHTACQANYEQETMNETEDLQHILAEFHPTYHFIDSNDIQESILTFVEKNNIDLLIALPKKHDLLEKLLHKSQSKRLTQGTPVPILTVHES